MLKLYFCRELLERSDKLGESGLTSFAEEMGFDPLIPRNWYLTTPSSVYFLCIILVSLVMKYLKLLLIHIF